MNRMTTTPLQLMLISGALLYLKAHSSTAEFHQKSRSTAYNEYDIASATDDSWSSSDIVGRYVRFDEILSWQTRLALRYPDIVKLFDIGFSYQGRPMKLLKIGTEDIHGSKWSVWLDGGIHAREHVTPATVVFIADQLVHSYLSNNTEAKWLLQHFNWYLLPVLNPDGYEYSFTREGRMWRKNRRPVAQNCTGVDLNRNWDIGWGGADSDRDPCSDQYMGERPETEPEVINVVNFLLPRADQFIAFVTFHSYGERILTRWDHTTNELPEDHPQLLYVANKMALAMQQPYGTEYEPGVASQLTYAFGGGSADWARAVAKIRYSYLIELRDNGQHGFQLPVDQVLPTGREAWAAVKELAAHILLNDGFSRPCRHCGRHRHRDTELGLRNPAILKETDTPPVHGALLDDLRLAMNNNNQRITFSHGNLCLLTITVPFISFLSCCH